MLQEFWANNISAELAVDTHSPDDLINQYKDEKHSWIIIIKQDSPDLGEIPLKVKSMDKKEDYDLRSSELLGFLKSEMRERLQREGAPERSRLLRRGSQPETPSSKDKEADVRVLVAQHRGKKTSRRNVVEAGKPFLKTMSAKLTNPSSPTQSPGTSSKLCGRANSCHRDQRRHP